MSEQETKQAYLCGESFDPISFINDLLEEDSHRAIVWLAEDVSWWLPGDPHFGGGTHTGVEGIRKFLTFGEWIYLEPPEVLWTKTWMSKSATTLELAVKGVTRMNRPYENQYALVFEMNEAGKVRFIREYHDPTPLYVAAEGLGPNPKI